MLSFNFGVIIMSRYDAERELLVLKTLILGFTLGALTVGFIWFSIYMYLHI